MRLYACSIAVLLLCLCSFTAVGMAAEDDLRAGEPFSGAKGWLNTAEPLTIDKLKGQVVLVDFWTYCCINCMHVMPELKFLEEKYKDQPFVVVGVHSGKFDQEKDIDNIRAACCATSSRIRWRWTAILRSGTASACAPGRRWC